MTPIHYSIILIHYCYIERENLKFVPKTILMYEDYEFGIKMSVEDFEFGFFNSNNYIETYQYNQFKDPPQIFDTYSLF